MFQNNPYNVLSETISFENVQQISELITLKCLRGYCAYQIVSAFHFYIRKKAAILYVDNRHFFMIAHLDKNSKSVRSKAKRL